MQAPATARERQEFKAQLSDAGLAYIAEICTAGSYVPNRRATAEEHLESLMRQAAAALECGPMFITVIGGCDAWTLTQSVEFFGEAMEIGKALGARVSFETRPDRYAHWKLAFDGPLATLTMDVDEDRGIRPGYKLKLNSYDLGVDIELADALQRIRFEHPEVRCVIVTSANAFGGSQTSARTRNTSF